MSAQTLTPADAAPPTQQPHDEPLLRAQAIACGDVTIAVPFTWARAVVEDFDVSPAPNAPVWLVGAVNVDGRILPVLDLAAWLDEHAAQPVTRSSKLLVGGEGEDRYALLFQGLPMMVRYAPSGAATGSTTGALAPFVTGAATPVADQAGRHWPVIDARTLGEHWAGELAV